MIKLHYAHSSAPSNLRRIFAQSTWPPDIELIKLDRTASDIGSTRGCYYVKDVFDQCLSLPEGAIFAYINDDVALAPEWKEAIEPSVLAYGCAYAHRINVTKFYKKLTMQDMLYTNAYAGADLFACTPAWWKTIRDEFPETVIGHEGWDFAMQWYMRKSGFDKIPIICYHEDHPAYWASNRATDPVQRIVRERLINWTNAVGANKYLGAPNNYLFWGFTDEYKNRPSLTVLGLAKWCGPTIRRLLDSVDIMTAGFGDTKTIILADLSTPRPNLSTSAGLDLSKGSSVFWQSKDILADELHKWQGGFSNRRVIPQLDNLPFSNEIGRYQKMAKLRNFVLQAGAPLNDWVLMIDMDSSQLLDAGGISAITQNNCQWDVVATYGIHKYDTVKNWHPGKILKWRGKEWTYYDILALESTKKERMIWMWHGQPYFHGNNIDATFVHYDITPDMDKWTPVNSAFGPATFYRGKTIEKQRYDEQTQQCEHQTFNASLKEKGAKIAVAGNIVGIY